MCSRLYALLFPTTMTYLEPYLLQRTSAKGAPADGWANELILRQSGKTTQACCVMSSKEICNLEIHCFGLALHLVSDIRNLLHTSCSPPLHRGSLQNGSCRNGANHGMPDFPTRSVFFNRGSGSGWRLPWLALRAHAQEKAWVV
jgi:hypothetical protein